MKSMPNLSVSVVMATYNGTQYLKEQLRSVLDELLPGDELIIVDDDSQDGTLKLLNSLDSAVVRVIRNPANVGVRATFERGLSLSNNEIIFLCDQDDVWLPGKRATFVGAFEQDPAVAVVISDAEVIDEQGRVIAPSFMATKHGFNGGIFATVWRNRYLGCAMALRRSLLASALPVPRQAPMHDMWFGAIGRMTGKVVYLPVPLLQYRRHTGNVSPSIRQSFSRMIRWRIALTFALGIRMLSLRFGLHDTQTDRVKSSEKDKVAR